MGIATSNQSACGWRRRFISRSDDSIVIKKWVDKYREWVVSFIANDNYATGGGRFAAWLLLLPLILVLFISMLLVLMIFN